ncbi:MAG: carboxypeptidase regulatory-like domain-containing protein [Sedimentisphaerales bacterium]|nr:carboxypeptidase regulatory-like domain-containing protein [Sedimentisphaerales bacterium]
MTPPVWITFLPVSPIRSLVDYQHSQKVESLSPENVKICEIEIRTASDNKRIARFTYDNYPMSSSRWGCKLNKQQIQEIGTVKDGTYLAAIYVNGIRCSNVAEFTIDSNADLSSEPVLKLVPFPLSVGQVLPNLGIIATGPNPTDSELWQSAIYFPNLFVDRIERKPIAMKWAGPDRVIQAGMQGVAIIDLENYTPAIALNESHEVWAKLGKHQSATVVIPASDTTDKNWDEITEKFYPATPPVVMLEGTVLGLDGKPAVYNVSVTLNNEKSFTTKSNSEGKYEFVNLPIGKYQLSCSPPQLGQPAFLVNDIQIREGHKEILNFDFTSNYSFSGTVSYEDGSPAVNIDVMATWEDGQTEFMNYDKTDEQGQYSISAPFETASYVGIGLSLPGYITPRQPYRNLKSGRNDVNFILKKPLGINANSTDIISNDKGSDPREFIKKNKSRWMHSLPYIDVVNSIKPESLPQLYEMLKDSQYSHDWTAIAAMICFISNDQNSVNEIIKYVQRPKDLSFDSFNVIGKSKILCWLGLIKTNQVTNILKNALTSEGAHELTKNWIDKTEDYNDTIKTKEEILGLIRGSTAIGLVHSQYPTNIRLVEQLYEQEHAKCKEKRIFTELYRQLVDAMAIRDLIKDIGMEEYLNLQGTEHNKLSPYIRKYDWHFIEIDSAEANYDIGTNFIDVNLVPEKLSFIFSDGKTLDEDWLDKVQEYFRENRPTEQEAFKLWQGIMDSNPPNQ